MPTRARPRPAVSRVVPAVLALLVVLLPGCTTSETACTLIGSVSGVSVRVEPDVATDVSALTLRVCWDLAAAAPRCRDASVELSPGGDTVDQGCDSTSPDAACSATVVPNGSKVGFAELDQLPAGPVTVVATAAVSGRSRRFPMVETAATTSFPNGPDCGAGGNQVQVVLGPDGLR